MPNFDGDHTLCLINPASAGGRTRIDAQHIISAIRKQLSPGTTIRETHGPQDAERMTASAAVMTAVRRLIIVGGDGTVQSCVNGLMSLPADLRKGVTMGLISKGTGQGLAQSLGLPRSIAAQLEIIRSGQCRAMDLGVVSFRGNGNKMIKRYFVNESQIGIGATVVAAVEQRSKWLGGTLTYGLTALREAFRQQNQTLLFSFDDRPAVSAEVFGVVVANGAWTGGGMNLVPGASVFDRRLDALLMLARPVPIRLASLARVYTGSHVLGGGFDRHTLRSLEISSSDEAYVEADGEPLGRTPASFSVQPEAVNVFVPGSER